MQAQRRRDDLCSWLPTTSSTAPSPLFGNLTDFSVIVNHRLYRCHKVVLADRCRFFHDLFACTPTLNSINISDVWTKQSRLLRSPSCFFDEVVLRLIYSGRLTSDMPIQQLWLSLWFMLEWGINTSTTKDDYTLTLKHTVDEVLPLLHQWIENEVDHDHDRSMSWFDFLQERLRWYGTQTDVDLLQECPLLEIKLLLCGMYAHTAEPMVHQQHLIDLWKSSNTAVLHRCWSISFMCNSGLSQPSFDLSLYKMHDIAPTTITVPKMFLLGNGRVVHIDSLPRGDIYCYESTAARSWPNDDNYVIVFKVTFMQLLRLWARPWCPLLLKTRPRRDTADVAQSQERYDDTDHVLSDLLWRQCVHDWELFMNSCDLTSDVLMIEHGVKTADIHAERMLTQDEWIDGEDAYTAPSEVY